MPEHLKLDIVHALAAEDDRIEALARLANDPAFDRAVPGRRAILVSDMLQNSELFTVYGRGRGGLAERVPPPGETARLVQQRFGDNLRGLYLEIRLIPREGWETDQRGELHAYWDQVFAYLGIRAAWYDI